MPTNPIKSNDPESVMDVMTKLNIRIDEKEGHSRRSLLPRRNLAVPILVQLLDENRVPCGATFEAVSQDISVDGIGFLCPGSVNASFALVQFRSTVGKHRPLLVEIRNTRAVGPFCHTGGRFCVDWSMEDATWSAAGARRTGHSMK